MLPDATYGVGKLLYGSIVDLPSVGGRIAFIYCMVVTTPRDPHNLVSSGGADSFLPFAQGTGVFTTLMSWARSEEEFMLCWGLARATQASGWIAMIKIVSAWTPAKRLGRTMAGCNLMSYLGDFSTRLLIGAVLASGTGWRGIFWMSGSSLTAPGVSIENMEDVVGFVPGFFDVSVECRGVVGDQEQPLHAAAR